MLSWGHKLIAVCAFGVAVAGYTAFGQASVTSADTANTNTATLIAEGKQLWNDNKIDEAKQKFLTAIELDPKSVEARLKLGGLYLSQHDNGLAIEQFQNAIGMDPDNAKVFVVLGIAYVHSGNYTLARNAVNEALSREPDLKEGKDLMAWLDTKTAEQQKAQSNMMSAPHPVQPHTMPKEGSPHDT